MFAQLITRGVNHGVHAFYVPICATRTPGEFLPGIGGEDDGIKGGLNGIDNGRLHFTMSASPAPTCSTATATSPPTARTRSPIASPGRRFFTMLGTLVQGRVSLDGAAVAASQAGLKTAITYANQRRQFNASSPTPRKRCCWTTSGTSAGCFTRLATTYAASFAHEQLLQKFDDVFSGAHDTDADRQDLETLAAALKPLSAPGTRWTPCRNAARPAAAPDS